MTHKKVIKTHRAILTPKSDTSPVTVQVDDSARLRQIRQLVHANNKSTLDENLIICQIYMESRFDSNASAAGSTARGLMQLTNGAVQQVYKYKAHSLDGAYKLYRGLSNGIYYKKIKGCADKLRVDPDSMQSLRDMVK